MSNHPRIAVQLDNSELKALDGVLSKEAFAPPRRKHDLPGSVIEQVYVSAVVEGKNEPRTLTMEAGQAQALEAWLSKVALMGRHLEGHLHAAHSKLVNALDQAEGS